VWIPGGHWKECCVGGGQVSARRHGSGGVRLQFINALRRAPAVNYCGSSVWKTRDGRAKGHQSGYEDRGERHGDGKQPEADRARSVRNSFVE
jgi:hypothetical protein